MLHCTCKASIVLSSPHLPCPSAMPLCLSPPSGCHLLPQLVVVFHRQQHHLQSVYMFLIVVLSHRCGCCIVIPAGNKSWSCHPLPPQLIAASTAVAPLPCPTGLTPAWAVKVDCYVSDGIDAHCPPCLRQQQHHDCCRVVVIVVVIVSLSSDQHYCCCRSNPPCSKG